MISRPPPLSGPNRIVRQPQPRYVDVTYPSCLPTSTYSAPSPIDIILRARKTMRASHLAIQTRMCHDLIARVARVTTQHILMWTSSIGMTT